MGVISVFLFMLFALGSFLITVGTMLYRTFATISSSPQGSAFKSRVANLQNQVAQLSNGLLLWENDSLNLLCASPLSEKHNGLLITTSTQGILGTIYQEPLAAYAKSHIGQAFILVVQTKNDEYLFRKTKQQTDIWLNSSSLGVLIDGNLLSGDKSGKLLAQLRGEPGSDQRDLVIDNKIAATLLLNHPTDDVNPRAVQLLADTSADHEKLIRAMVFYYILGSKAEV